MGSDDLIDRLGRHPPRRGWLAPGAMLFGAVLLSLVASASLSLLLLKPRNDLAFELFSNNRLFSLKILFALSLAITAFFAVRDLSIPGRAVRLRLPLLATPFVIVLAMALREIAVHHSDPLSNSVDHTMIECLWQIPVLAAPALLILGTVVRGLAPTNLTLTGACVGLLAGTIGAFGYALHCHHDTFAFVGTVYALAVIETAVIGAVVAPRILRW